MKLPEGGSFLPIDRSTLEQPDSNPIEPGRKIPVPAPDEFPPAPVRPGQPARPERVPAPAQPVPDKEREKEDA